MLNSLITEWFYGLISSRVRGGYLRAFSDYMQQIPILRPGKQVVKAIESAVEKIQENKQKDPHAHVGELESQIDGLVAHLYGLTEEEYRTILDDLALPDPVRLGALNAYRETTKRFTK